MKKHFFDRIGETVYSGELDNGLTVFVVPKRGFTKSYAFLAVNYGAADTRYFINGTEFKSPDGVAHFLEHKMFDMEQGNALQMLTELGAQPNAFTSTDITAYYFETTRKFYESLKILMEFVTTAYFTQDSVDKEQGIIGQEIAMVENNPHWQVYINLCRAIYKNHPVRVAVAGTRDSISEITAETLIQCHNLFYNPGNMVLCVVGDVNPEEIFSFVGNISTKSDYAQTEYYYGPPEPKGACEHFISDQRELSVPIFMAGYKCESSVDGWSAAKEELIADMAFQVVAGPSTRFYSSLYENGMINESFDWSWDTCRGTATLMFGGECKEPEAVTEKVHGEFQRILQDGIDGELFLRLKKAFVGRCIRSYDSFEAICYAQASAHFKGVDCFHLPELTESITVDEIINFIRRNLTAENLALSVIFPKEKNTEEIYER